MLDFAYNGRSYSGWSADDARAAGVPAAVIGAALKAGADKDARAFAANARAGLATSDPGKLAVWQLKAAIAADPAAATVEELALIDREATARGTDRAGLLAAIAARAAAYRQIALLIEALEAETRAAIAAIPDDAPDIEAQIASTLAQARAQADTAFADATALINGGA